MLSQPNVYSWVDWPATRLPFRACISVIIIAALRVVGIRCASRYGVLALLVLGSSAASNSFLVALRSAQQAYRSTFSSGLTGRGAHMIKRRKSPTACSCDIEVVSKCSNTCGLALLRCPRQYDDVVRYRSARDTQ